MGDRSPIEWTDATWNPIRGCSRVSEGCRHCYAEAIAARFSDEGMPYAGLAKAGKWTGRMRFVESVMDLPLRWRKPRRIFVNSMSDLFHEAVPDEWIDRIFAVMALAPQHTFQVLTKRPERMCAYLREPDTSARWLIQIARHGSLAEKWAYQEADAANWMLHGLLNVWLGVSVENQEAADARIPLLLKTPATVRWVSYEPALGPVRFDEDWLRCEYGGTQQCGGPYLDWLVIGGESAPGARPFDCAWARQTIAQGRAAGVPVFVKQLGARPYSMTGQYGDPFFGAKALLPTRGEEDRWYLSGEKRDRKGGDPAEWPEDLRVREYPPCATRAS